MPKRPRPHRLRARQPQRLGSEQLEPRLVFDSTVVFNEIMYHPAVNEPALEWVELYNQMAVDMDLSGWSISGGVDFTFAEGTILPGRGHLVIATSPEDLEAASGFAGSLGPLLGSLNNSGETLELHNNSGRLMDELSYGDNGDWPVGPDGGGVSLAKRNPLSASGPAENWTVSLQMGGTPGSANFVDPTTLPRVTDTLLPLATPARVLVPTAAGQVAANWNSQNFNDAAAAGWFSRTTGVGFDTSGTFAAQGVLNAAGQIGPQTQNVNASAFVRLPFQVNSANGFDTLNLGLDYDDGFVAYLNGVEVARRNAPQGQPLYNATATQSSVSTLTYRAGDDLLAMELASTTGVNPNGPWTYGGRTTPTGTFTAYPASLHLNNWGSAFNPPKSGGIYQGYGFDTAAAVPAIVVNTTSFADSPCCGITPIDSHKIFTHPGDPGAGPSDPYDSTDIRWTAPAAGTVVVSANWAQRHSTPSQAYVLINNVQVFTQASSAGAGTTYAPASFTVQAGDRIDFVTGPNLQTGYGANSTQFDASVAFTPAPGPGQFAHVDLDLTGFLGELVAGTNVLAIQGLNVSASDGDFLLRPQLTAREVVPTLAQSRVVALNEVAASTEANFWVEVVNTSAQPVNLQGYTLASSALGVTPYSFGAVTLPVGGYLAVTEAQLGFHPANGDKNLWYSGGQSQLQDAQVVTNRLRGLAAGHGDEWLFPTTATPGAANTFALHDEIAINEIMYAPRSQELDPTVDTWIELFNRSNTAVDLSGWALDDAVGYTFPLGTTMAPGEYLVVAKNAAHLQTHYPGVRIVGNFSGSLSAGGDLVRLVDANNNPADEVKYYDSGTWPEYADGGGASLELRNPAADNAQAEAWAASNEGAKTAWRTYTYRQIATPDTSQNTWKEFIFGMLDAGEVLIDNVSVIKNPATTPTQVIQNGTFEADVVGSSPSKWRFMGDHHGTVIVDPTNPANKVVRLVAGGTTDHNSDHGETTLVGNEITLGAEYEVSFRAKWIGGSNQLNSRLYLAKVASTTLVDVPALGGTPGAVNSTYQANVGPTYSDFKHGPVTPSANQSVTVSVMASDPQGMASMTLFYSVASGAWNSVAMTAGANGRYSGVIPGQAAASIVQFYVQGQDAQGATSTFPAAGTASRALYKVNDGQPASATLDTIRMLMTPADVANFEAIQNRMSNELVPITVVYNENEVFYDVGVRFKGSPFGRIIEDRRDSYYIQFHPDQLFRGAHQVIEIDGSAPGNLSQGGPDELILNQLMNHAGGPISIYNDIAQVISPNPGYSGPKILMLSRYSNEFFDESFANGGDGQQFELEMINYQTNTLGNFPEGIKDVRSSTYFGTDIQNLGDDKEKYRWNLLIKNHRDEDDYSRIIEFAKAFSLNGQALDDATQQLMDIDQWMQMYATFSLNGNTDVYGSTAFGTGHHNFRVYIRPSDNKVLALPWDQDVDFTAPINAPLYLNNFNIGKIISLPANKRLLYGHLQDMIATSYNAAYATKWQQEYGSLAGLNYTSHATYLQNRANYVTQQLAIVAPQIPFLITTNGGNNFSVAANTATISGEGWINVREIRLAGDPQALPVKWTGEKTWQVTIPLSVGANPITFEAFNFQGQSVGSDSITITSTVDGPSQTRDLRITEVMYHPADPAGGGPYSNNDFEFIELQNIGTFPLPVGGASLAGGVTFNFPAMTLAPGQHVLVVGDTAAFESRYGAGFNIAGEFSGNLSNGGEPLALVGSLGQTILDFTYSALWAPTTDGTGPSLVIIDPAGTTASWTDGASWRASTLDGGSPGTVDPLTAVVGRHVFYNNSVFDGNDSAANQADDLARATTKNALKPGDMATFANYTSYTSGINGLMIDFNNLLVTPTAGDFQFRVGNVDNVAAWTAAPLPISVDTRTMANGRQRVTLVWSDGAIKNTWLEVRVGTSLGLNAQDVFYFGNAIGETGNSALDASVNASDEIGARNNPRSFVNPSPVDGDYDFNRDGFVNAADQIIARSNASGLNPVKLIHPGASLALSSTSAAGSPSTMFAVVSDSAPRSPVATAAISDAQNPTQAGPAQAARVSFFEELGTAEQYSLAAPHRSSLDTFRATPGHDESGLDELLSASEPLA